MTEGRPTLAYIDLQALDHNLAQVRARAGGRKVLGVVKADAYGHGAAEVARRLESRGVEMLGVALVEEGARLRQAGVMLPILVLGGVFGWQAEGLLDYDLTPVVSTMEQAALFSDAALRRGRTMSVHFKVDTGMGRVGMLPDEAVGLIADICRLPGIVPEGVMTHLADVGGADKSFAGLQIGLFKTVLERLETSGIKFPLVHAAGSAAIVEFDPALFNMVRPGIMLYGCYPEPHMREYLDLRPVMSVRTRVMHVKTLEAGRPVSYGRTYVTPSPTVIATLPIGYADGFNRRLSNRGEVLVGGMKCPVLGRVCMDLIMVDATAVTGVKSGDEAVVLGRQGDAVISAEDVAELLGTISYEVLCNVSARVPRVYIY
ncbi:MAG: alanine racemase [Nitrospirae bacterium]|nr:alanine racemase [Nitrospirota bacterium]